MLVAKMHGAGNDFVVVAGAPPAPGQDAALVRALAHRQLGIGADGVLFLEQTAGADADLRMHFYNCDGRRAGLCLNGARCAALRAVQLGWATDRVRIRTEFTMVEARVDAAAPVARVELRLPAPSAPSSAARVVELPEGSISDRGWAVNTGDPHLVVECSGVADLDFETAARPLRWWTGPDPAGSNVHFVERAAGAWTIRSFERGIEGETLACGSGCVSTLLALGSDAGRLTLTTRTGALIDVAFEGDQLVLAGPAVCVFTTHWPEGSAD